MNAGVSVSVSLGADLPPAAPPYTLAAADAESLLGSYRGTIYSFIRRKGFTAEEADDLTQETLIRAYLHLAGFRGATLDGWLYRIAANVAVDHVRKRRVATVPLESVALMDSGEEDALVHLDRAARRDRVLAVIGQLPECHQRILRLRYYEDRSLTEIADAMQCSPMAAKLRVFRAVTALRKRCRSLALDGDLMAG
ncbi:MAG: polymerase, sigma-24 subunit, subfamily [Armatimonadetes bacterium]|jgi:RNA polymerase sigma-70 factor (ECF subfamily)|nr:polymerase, sigma-24 subunit, subfamily [Armatimonadota bacterium]